MLFNMLLWQKYKQALKAAENAQGGSALPEGLYLAIADESAVGLEPADLEGYSLRWVCPYIKMTEAEQFGEAMNKHAVLIFAYSQPNGIYTSVHCSNNYKATDPASTAMAMYDSESGSMVITDMDGIPLLVNIPIDMDEEITAGLWVNPDAVHYLAPKLFMFTVDQYQST